MSTLPIVISFTALATVAVGLRLWTRFRMVRTAGWDDGLSVAALLADFVFFAFAVLEFHRGLGHSQSTLSQNTITVQLKAFYFTILFYNLTLTFAKISTLTLYLRLFPPFPGTSGHYRLAIYISMFFISLVGLWLVLSSILFCVPVSDFWQKAHGNGRCLPEGVWFVNAGLQIGTDIWVVLLPMPVLGRLKVSRRVRWGLVVVFGVGIFVCVMSIVRLFALAKLVGKWDVTRFNAPAANWSSIEANVAIICSCLPPLRPLLVRILPPSLRGSEAIPRDGDVEADTSGRYEKRRDGRLVESNTGRLGRDPVTSGMSALAKPLENQTLGREGLDSGSMGVRQGEDDGIRLEEG